MIAQGNTLIVDVRDAMEVEKSGKIAGAVNVSRGLLEFRADPDSPSHDKSFAKDKNVIVYCGDGGHAARRRRVSTGLSAQGMAGAPNNVSTGAWRLSCVDGLVNVVERLFQGGPIPPQTSTHA